jgi:biopolymer transport protein ExbD
MGMSSSSGDGGHGAPKADINTTPLVDVMLVLLIIFMITAPLMADKIKVDLPTATADVEDKDAASQGPRFTLTIVREQNATQPKYYWGEQLVTTETLTARMRAEATNSNNRVRLKIRASKFCKYEDVSAILKMAKNTGIQNVSFVSSPDRKAG